MARDSASQEGLRHTLEARIKYVHHENNIFFENYLPFLSIFLIYFVCFSLEPKTERDDLINPLWIEDKDLKKGEMNYISTNETQFWKDLLDKYLYPIDEDKDEKVRRTSSSILLLYFNLELNALFFKVKYLSKI